MIFKDFYKVLHCEYCDDLFERVFEQGQFSFTEDKIIDQLSMHKNAELEEVISNARTFGLIIKGNSDGDVILPANLPFTIHKSSLNNSNAFYIKRNVIEYSIDYIDSNEEINVVLTDFGKKFMQYMKESDTSIIDEAYKNLLQIEQIFGVEFK